MKRSRWALIAVVAALILGLASPADGRVLTFDVVGDFDTFEMIESSPGHGPFYIGGTIFKEGTDEVIGTFHCWGTFFGNGAAVVSQEYDFFGRGKILVQGVEDEGRRAIVGGTREFKHISGQATGFDFSTFADTGFFDGKFVYKRK